MRKLVLIPVIAGLLGGASPAWAIHDPPGAVLVPAGNCAAEGSQAVGHPAAPVLRDTPAGVPHPGNSAAGLSHNGASPRCANL